jgi:hypothetical protein
MTEGPYTLPEGWRWARLGEVVITSSGNSKLIKGRLHSEPEPGFYPGFSALVKMFGCRFMRTRAKP